MKLLTVVLFLSTLLGAVSCHQGFVAVTPVLPVDTTFAKGISVQKDIVYKITDEDSLRLDLFLPVSEHVDSLMPLVIYIHGGSWVAGDKKSILGRDRKLLTDSLLSRGYAVASINYRLLNKDKHLPVSILDCKDAVRWFRKNADKLRIDGNNIGLWGSSAGGHLALMAAYTSDTLFSDTSTIPAGVKYVIDHFGPADLNKLLYTGLGAFPVKTVKLLIPRLYEIRQKTLEALCDSTTIANKKKLIETCGAFSPLVYADQRAVPTLIYHGDADKIVPLAQSRKLAEILDKAGIPNKLTIYPDTGHGFANLTDSQLQEMIQTVLTFIEQTE